MCHPLPGKKSSRAPTSPSIICNLSLSTVSYKQQQLMNIAINSFLINAYVGRSPARSNNGFWEEGNMTLCQSLIWPENWGLLKYNPCHST